MLQLHPWELKHKLLVWSVPVDLKLGDRSHLWLGSTASGAKMKRGKMWSQSELNGYIFGIKKQEFVDELGGNLALFLLVRIDGNCRVWGFVSGSEVQHAEAGKQTSEHNFNNTLKCAQLLYLGVIWTKTWTLWALKISPAWEMCGKKQLK